VEEVNRLIKQFLEMKKMMKMRGGLAGGKGGGKLRKQFGMMKAAMQAQRTLR
jgi:signal recognition particle GTPase